MSIILMILLIGLLIFVHEAGHFLAARAFGIKVEKFGFGLPFGPTIYKTKYKDIEILVHAFLLGGYVSFPDDDKDCDLPADSPERFSNTPTWQRAIVVSAGVVANVLCAFLLVYFVAFTTKQLPTGSYEVSVTQLAVPQSELKAGDIILSANGCDINNDYSLRTIIKNSAKNNGIVTQSVVDKNYELLKGLNPGLEKDEIIPAELSIRLPENVETDIITMDKYALKGAKYFKKEGFKLDDKLKSLSKDLVGKAVYTSNGEFSLYDVAKAISDGRHPINLVVLRDGEKVNLKPVYPDENGVLGIGLGVKQGMVKTDTFSSAIKEGSKYLVDNTGTMMYSLGQLFTGNIPLKDLHGVVAITKIGGDMMDRAGKASGVLLTALISMNLAILNILPIPALDGGHLLFLFIEKITGKPVNEEVQEKISSVFFSLLIILMVVVIFNDIVLLAKG